MSFRNKLDLQKLFYQKLIKRLLLIIMENLILLKIRTKQTKFNRAKSYIN